MPTLLNYSGEDDLYNLGSFYSNSIDSSLHFSFNPHVGVYCPPRKRSRISGPITFRRSFEAAEKPAIEVLPDECLFEIFRRLDGGKERSSCACVSKHWLSLLSNMRKSETFNDGKEAPPASSGVEMLGGNEDQELESDGYLTRCLEGKKATDMRLAAIAVGTSGRGGLGKLSIRGSNSTRGVTSVGLTAIASGCPSLRALSLWSVPSIGDDGLIGIANGCHMLEKLDLCECPSISDKGLVAIAKSCPNLTALNIESCSNIGNESLHTIGRFCTKLRSISIKGCYLVGDHGVGSLLSSASSVLAKVKLQDLRITDFSLAVIGHYGKNISSLVLSGLQLVSEKGFWVMGNARGLQMLASLTITSCRGITNVSLEAMGRGSANLRHMFLRKCCFVSDEGLAAFVKAVGSLESLQLEECNRFTQNGVVGALSNCGSKFKSLSLIKCMGITDLNSELPISPPCKSLRTLSIRNCPRFGASSLTLIGKLCPHLQNLDLSGLCGITNDGLLPLLHSCEEGLLSVNLSGCLNLTDEVIFDLARLHGSTLQLLNLDGCSKLTDASLLAIAGNCPLLSDLDVSRCAVTDSGVAALSCEEQLNLQVLSLSGCSKISNGSMPFLRKMGNSLVGLNLQHCNSISSSVVELLVGSLWRCDILF